MHWQHILEGMQIGGGVNTDNAEKYLDMGASHVIVTSYVFRDGIIDYDRLENLSHLSGKRKTCTEILAAVLMAMIIM